MEITPRSTRPSPFGDAGPATPLRAGNSAISGAAAGSLLGMFLGGPEGAVIGAATFAVINTIATGAGKDLFDYFRSEDTHGAESANHTDNPKHDHATAP